MVSGLGSRSYPVGMGNHSSALAHASKRVAPAVTWSNCPRLGSQKYTHTVRSWGVGGVGAPPKRYAFFAFFAFARR
jgi:hypothetical protein